MNLLEECPPLVSSPALNYPESLLIARRLGPSSQRETDDDATEHIESRAESIPIPNRYKITVFWPNNREKAILYYI